MREEDQYYINAMHETTLQLIPMLCDYLEFSTIDSSLYSAGIKAHAIAIQDAYESKLKLEIGHDLMMAHLLKYLIQHLDFKNEPVKSSRLEMLKLVQEWEKSCYKELSN